MINVKLGLAATLIVGMAASATAAPILVAGPSPVAPFGGTVIDFEGVPEGTLIKFQYVGLGVGFSQPDTGSPQIDNAPMIFGYGAGSGTGVLTGSTDGGAAFPTIAGITARFVSPVAQAGAFMSDTAPLGDYTIYAFGDGGVTLESFIVPAAAFQAAGCGQTFPVITGCGVFVGFSRPAADMVAIRFGPSAAVNDSFAIDDFRFVPTAVPEPGTLALVGLGLVTVARRVLRRRA